MLLRLEHQGKTLFEISSSAIKEPVIIGRSSQCQWQAPCEDEFLSKRHAEISVKRKKVTIRDLDSRNGIFFQGERIKERRLVEGDKITMGNLALFAEKEVAQSKVTLKHRLTVKSGKSSGVVRDIPPVGSALTVGSDPSSGLLFLDALISKHHAELRLHADGACWLQDMNSKNSTRVNGELLPGGKERLLRCGDVISFAHIDAVYTDGTESKALRNTLIQGTIMVVCAAVLLAAYKVYTNFLIPATPDFISAARELDKGEKFDDAIAFLKSASDSPDAKKHQSEIQQLLTDTQRWKAIFKGWMLARSAVDGGDYVAAIRELSGILADDVVGAWTWNDIASKELPQAKIIKKLLDQQAFVKEMLLDPRTTSANFRGTVDQLSSMTNEIQTVKVVNVKKVMAVVNEDLANLKQALSELQEMESALALLNKPGVDAGLLARISKVVESAGKSRIRAVNERARLVYPAVAALYQGYDQFDLLLKAYQGLELDRADTIKVTPDEAGEFIKDAILSAGRHQLAASEKQLRACITEVRGRYRRIMTGPQWYEDMQVKMSNVEDAGLLEKVFACDSLSFPFPKRTRSVPSGEFDRIVGLEYFQDSLERLTTDLQVVSNQTETPWQPVMGEVVDLLHEMEGLLGTLDNPEYKPFHGGKQAESESQIRELLKRRDAIRTNLLARMKQGDRGGLIAGVLTGLLSDSDFRVDGTPLRQTLMELRRKIDGEVQALYVKYQSASIADKIKLREAILDKGVPSHRVVKSMWAARASVSAPRAAQ